MVSNSICKELIAGLSSPYQEPDAEWTLQVESWRGRIMNIPARISHYLLLTELVRRIESGWEPEDERSFCELYLALTDAWLRAEHQAAMIDERR